MIVFANTITPRLRYISDFFGNEILGTPFEITSDLRKYIEHRGPRINYSNTKIAEPELRIADNGLLAEHGVRPRLIECFETKGFKAFFRCESDFPFDIFAASFYLLSRYEEYLPHQKDEYGRYGYRNSLAFQENFLHLPLINIWLAEFRTALEIKFPGISAKEPAFRFIPTYDIDEAFAYKHKQWWRTIGALVQASVTGRFSSAIERIRALRGISKDPYDAFDIMNGMNEKYHLQPIYFFLVAPRTAGVDKNILPSNRAMQELIVQHSRHYSVGVHPSWQSGDDVSKLKQEISMLGRISGKIIECSRQHFIRFDLPNTYRRLLQAGIRSDFSMGYGSINGFRASVASPFYWYDLENEMQTGLLLYPFCFMDANSFYEQKYSPEEAGQELRRYFQAVKDVGGTFITIWHNNFFGTAKRFRGWRQVFEDFLSQL